jgi:hypothetical protein
MFKIRTRLRIKEIENGQQSPTKHVGYQVISVEKGQFNNVKEEELTSFQQL